MLNKVTLFLVILGAVNMGMSTWAHVDVITVVFGDLNHIVSAMVGLSGMYMLLSNYTTLLKKA